VITTLWLVPVEPEVENSWPIAPSGYDVPAAAARSVPDNALLTFITGPVSPAI
jgi:hypothetical protein